MASPGFVTGPISLCQEHGRDAEIIFNLRKQRGEWSSLDTNALQLEAEYPQEPCKADSCLSCGPHDLPFKDLVLTECTPFSSLLSIYS